MARRFPPSVAWLLVLLLAGVGCADDALLDQRARELSRTCLSFGERRQGDDLDRDLLVSVAAAEEFRAHLAAADNGLFPSGVDALAAICQDLRIEDIQAALDDALNRPAEDRRREGAP